jgi:invasin C
MSIGIQGGAGGVVPARLVDTGAVEGEGARIRDGRPEPQAEVAAFALAAVASGCVRRHEKLGDVAPPVLAAPVSVSAAKTSAAVVGMEALSSQMSLTQSSIVADAHGALARKHVSAAMAEGGAVGANRIPFASDKSFEVMLALGLAVQRDVQSNIEMQGKLTMLARNAMMNVAEQDRNIGNTQMNAAISGGMFQVATSLGGTWQQMKGLNTKSMSIKNELKPQAELRRIHAEQSFELRSMHRPGIEHVDGARADITRGTGEAMRHDIEASGDSLRLEHQRALAQDDSARQHRIDMHGARHDLNQIEANRQQARGDVINMMGHVGKGLSDGISAQRQGSDRAEQKEAESAQQVSTAMANARNEAAQRYRDAVQRAIEGARGQLANANAVAAAVAGNLRA